MKRVLLIFGLLFVALVALPATAHAASKHRGGHLLTWSIETVHLDWSTMTRVTHRERHVYVIHYPKGRVIGYWSRLRHLSPHIQIQVTYPRYWTAPRSVQPIRPSGGQPMTVYTTGYDDVGLTASGLPAGYGRVAVDPSVFSLGTRFWIPGYGDAVAADTGVAVIGMRLDLWFPTASECFANTGYRTIYVLR